MPKPLHTCPQTWRASKHHEGKYEDKRIRGRKAVALRKHRLSQEPLCRMCMSKGRVAPSTVPDHIVPLSKGGGGGE